MEMGELTHVNLFMLVHVLRSLLERGWAMDAYVAGDTRAFVQAVNPPDAHHSYQLSVYKVSKGAREHCERGRVRWRFEGSRVRIECAFD